jgi:hypothetical protein
MYLFKAFQSQPVYVQEEEAYLLLNRNLMSPFSVGGFAAKTEKLNTKG